MNHVKHSTPGDTLQVDSVQFSKVCKSNETADITNRSLLVLIEYFTVLLKYYTEAEQ